MKNFNLILTALLALPASSSAQFGDFDEKVIYGVDSRKEYFEVQPEIRVLADSVASLWSENDLEALPNGSFRLKAGKFSEMNVNGGKVCANEPYREQPAGAGCSASLVGEDLLLTAGHCVSSQAQCDRLRIVFGFNISVIGGEAPTTFPASDVFFCKEIVKSAFESSDGEMATDRDFSVLRLKRKVEGRSPLRLNRAGGLAKNDPVFVIGHPMGLPVKIADDATVVKLDEKALFFEANLDTYGRNSGSPVFNGRTNLIEGVLVRGNKDFNRSPEGCMLSNVVPQNIDDGEDVTKTSVFAEFVTPTAEEAAAGPVPVDSSSITVAPSGRSFSFD